MQSLRGARVVLPRSYGSGLVASGRARSLYVQSLSQRLAPSCRYFSISQRRLDEALNAAKQTEEEIEKVVREVKQRFRDTLPSGYLNEEEYRLYERLYGPPLRETGPEDVGIDTHADMDEVRSQNERTLLRELEGGEFEEIAYQVQRSADEDGTAQLEGELAEIAAREIAQKAPGYIDVVARNQREYDALQRLQRDFEESKRMQNEAERAAIASEAEEEAAKAAEAIAAAEEEETWDAEEEADDVRRPGRESRYHPYSLDGRFHGNPVEILLPQNRLVRPITSLLSRSHLDHVKAAAEDAFGGRGLPTSPATPAKLRNGRMVGVGLPPDRRHMTEIEADAFLAAYMPPAYASVLSILREVRKRVGSKWIQSRLSVGPEAGLSVLDAGAGGAGMVAWENIVQAEWDILKEKGEVKGEKIPGKKTVVVGSDRLRHRVKTFLQNTTFLPRLPDYEHSGPMQGEHLDGSGTPQKRKSYDVIIASHLLLNEQQDHHRQAVLNNLWTLLNKDGGILILIEKAHPRGFEAVAHARDVILNRFLKLKTDGQSEEQAAAEDINPAYEREREPGHIIAPCTNHGTCPMYQETGKSQGRKDFCHFSQRFVRPSFYGRMLSSTQGRAANTQGEVEFSYVAVQRGVAKNSGISGKEATEKAFRGYEDAEKPDMQSLPRILSPPIKRKGHVVMDMCTAEGKMERWTVPKSFSKQAYHDARKSSWGDLWALGAKTMVPKAVRAGRGVDDGGKRAADTKKPRRVEVTMDGGRMSANEKNAPRERRASKADRRKDLVKELLEEEEAEDREIDREIDVEVEAELEADKIQQKRQ
ncbi:37S ribosomal protein S22 [Lecanicillium sp. MT-2017a]|nr:37S ribosomal protein S22 [Lecanicillium sp. MT-2017a]